MSQDRFYVAHDGQQQGPLSLNEIVQKVQSRELEVSDYLFCEEQGDWVILMAHSALSEKLKTLKPSAPPPTTVKNEVLKKDSPVQAEWYVLKGDNKFGPFAFKEVVKMLQDKAIYEFDFVWRAGLTAWEPIATLDEFKPSSIRGLLESGGEALNEVFFRRRHARAPFGTSILVHDNKRVYKGAGIEISAGGASVKIDSATFQPGDKVYLHFKPGDSMPPFNATCEIISKRHVNSSDKDAPVQYGVKFTQINQQTQELLNDFARGKKAAAA